MSVTSSFTPGIGRELVGDALDADARDRGAAERARAARGAGSCRTCSRSPCRAARSVKVPLLSSTSSAVIFGIWKSGRVVIASIAYRRALLLGAVYFEYSSTMSCSCDRRRDLARAPGSRSTLAVSESWSACSQAGTVGGQLGRLADHVGGRASSALIVITSSGLHLVAGDVDAAAVDRPVAVADRAGAPGGARRRSRAARARCRGGTRAGAAGSRR